MYDKILKFIFKIPMSIGLISYTRFLYFYYIRKSFKTLYPIESSDHGMAKRNNVTALQGNTDHLKGNLFNFFSMVRNKFNGQRSSLLIHPFKSLDYLNFKNQKILSIGPRLESEIFNFIKHGFLKNNISAIDIQSYSSLINLGDMLSMPYDDDKFDIIFCGWVLVYTNEIKKAVDEMIRVTKNGGYIAVGISHKPEVKLTKESLNNSYELINYFKPHIKRIIFNHHAGDLRNDINQKKFFRCVLILEIKK